MTVIWILLIDSHKSTWTIGHSNNPILWQIWYDAISRKALRTSPSAWYKSSILMPCPSKHAIRGNNRKFRLTKGAPYKNNQYLCVLNTLSKLLPDYMYLRNYAWLWMLIVAQLVSSTWRNYPRVVSETHKIQDENEYYYVHQLAVID